MSKKYQSTAQQKRLNQFIKKAYSILGHFYERLWGPMSRFTKKSKFSKGSYFAFLNPMLEKLHLGKWYWYHTKEKLLIIAAILFTGGFTTGLLLTLLHLLPLFVAGSVIASSLFWAVLFSSMAVLLTGFVPPLVNILKWLFIHSLLLGISFLLVSLIFAVLVFLFTPIYLLLSFIFAPLLLLMTLVAPGLVGAASAMLKKYWKQSKFTVDLLIEGGYASITVSLLITVLFNMFVFFNACHCTSALLHMFFAYKMGYSLAFICFGISGTGLVPVLVSGAMGYILASAMSVLVNIILGALTLTAVGTFLIGFIAAPLKEIATTIGITFTTIIQMLTSLFSKTTLSHVHIEEHFYRAQQYSAKPWKNRSLSFILFPSLYASYNVLLPPYKANQQSDKNELFINNSIDIMFQNAMKGY